MEGIVDKFDIFKYDKLNWAYITNKLILTTAK
jgi:hypothetical protein